METIKKHLLNKIKQALREFLNQPDEGGSEPGTPQNAKEKAKTNFEKTIFAAKEKGITQEEITKAQEAVRKTFYYQGAKGAEETKNFLKILEQAREKEREAIRKREEATGKESEARQQLQDALYRERTARNETERTINTALKAGATREDIF